MPLSPFLLVLVGLVLLGTLAVVGVVLWRQRRRRSRGNAPTAPVLVFPVQAETGPRNAPTTEPPSPRVAEPVPPSSERETSSDPEEVRRGPPEPVAHDEPRRGTAGSGPTPSEPNPDPVGPQAVQPQSAPPGSGPPPDGLDGYEAPPDGTLQLLPGRLIVEVGDEEGREVRFMQVPGHAPEFTLGRSRGPEHRHFRFDTPAVSRIHARMRFHAGGWYLRNLSSTNPTLVDGERLEGDAEAALDSGARIELGDVVLRFEGPKASGRLEAGAAPAKAERGGRGPSVERSAPPEASSPKPALPPSVSEGSYSERGLRSINQDSVLVRRIGTTSTLAAVSDGMGAHGAGGTASRLALQALEEFLLGGRSLSESIREANRAIRAAAAADRGLEGMGTTLVALLIEGSTYQVANVGDSRAYLVKSRSIEQITQDHSFVAEATASGEMTVAEAWDSPWKSAITRNLGGRDDVEVDLFDGVIGGTPLEFVLMSDGVHTALSEKEIVRAVRGNRDLNQVAMQICDRAILQGSRDNVTAVVIRVE